MTFKDMFIQNKYKNFGQESVLRDLIEPALGSALCYRQVLPKITSGQIKDLLSGIIALSRKNGKIKLIITPVFAAENNMPEDSESLLISVKQKIETSVYDLLKGLSELELKYISELVIKGYIEIQLAISKSGACVYEQVGIVEDDEGNAFAFNGGFNACGEKEYEFVRVFRNWNSPLSGYVSSEIREFDSIWEHNNNCILCADYSKELNGLILQCLSDLAKESGRGVITLKDYQSEAIESWVNKNHLGFLVMATGTGKTWTAIYAAKKMLETHPANLVICVPYKHLLKQWAEDLRKVFTNANIILVSSENPDWSVQLKNAIIYSKYDASKQVIIVSTIKSFYSERFRSAFELAGKENLLIVDEAHRFTQRPEALKQIFPYRMGLSATPFSGKSEEKGKELMRFFGGQAYNLPIEDALARDCLVQYYYHPIFVHTSAEDEKEFAVLTKRIASCFNQSGICINPELLTKTLRARLRIISMVDEKMTALDRFLSGCHGSDHFIVYCGDGRMTSSNGEEKRHIQAVKELLSKHDFRVSQFTAEENIDQRMELIRAFNNGDISALAAIRCLDEGINIPSIESAVILSSNDDYREFVQRRGRILRKYEGKEFARIYDMIVLPTENCVGIANIELRRFAEYARLAINRDELSEQLDSLLNHYGLTMNEISIIDNELEAELDE